MILTFVNIYFYGDVGMCAHLSICGGVCVHKRVSIRKAVSLDLSSFFISCYVYGCLACMSVCALMKDRRAHWGPLN